MKGTDMSDTPIYDNIGNESVKHEPTQTPNKWIPSPEVRTWFYGVLVALGAVGVGYGIITAEQSGLWLSLASAILGLGNLLAARNTPKGK